MKIGFVGWGVETQSAFRYFGPANEYVITNEEPRDDFPEGDNIKVYSLENKRDVGLVGNVEDLSYLDHLSDCELVVYQPSAHKNLEKHFPLDSPFGSNQKLYSTSFLKTAPPKISLGSPARRAREQPPL